MPQAPSDYKTAGILMLIAGILTTLASLGWVAGLIWICVGAFWILTLAVGIFEIIVGAAVMSGTYKPTVKTISILGIVAGFLCGNLIGAVLEIIAVVHLGKPEVVDWMSQQA